MVQKLRTLDLSKNNLHRANRSHNPHHSLDRLGTLTELKILNLEANQLPAGSVHSIAKLTKLQNLSLAGNQLGKTAATSDAKHHHQQQQQQQPLPASLPSSLKQLNLAANFFSSIPPAVLSTNLSKLEKLDLSSNQLTTVPDEIAVLVQLEELRLDSNHIRSLPTAVGRLSKLKALSLRNNQLQHTSASSQQQQQQPLPSSLFTDTRLIDLNLHGNRLLTNTQLNDMDGFQDFLDRRQKVKSKTMTNLDVCGLE